MCMAVLEPTPVSARSPLLLSMEAVAQSRLRRHAVHSRKCTPEPPCGTTLRRTARSRPTRWPISEPTLRSDPAASPGVYATASAKRSCLGEQTEAPAMDDQQEHRPPGGRVLQSHGSGSDVRAGR